MLTALLGAVLFYADGAAPGLPHMGLDDATPRLELFAVETEYFRFGMTASASGRVAIPLGAVDQGNITSIAPNVIVITDRVQYLDLFKVGYGATLEADIMFRPPPPDPMALPFERTPAMGAYVAFGWDWFQGDHITDSFGTRVDPHTLELPSILVGFKASGTVERNFFGNLKFGVGAAHFPSLKADMMLGGVKTEGEIFADTWVFAMELVLEFGVRLGPAALKFGMGGRIIGPPESGRNIDFNPGLMFPLDFSVGVELGF